jgi:CBS domain-containing protein
MEAFQVAIAGPLVNFGLFGFLVILGTFFDHSRLLKFVFSDLATVNLILCLFNLIPGLPLDGGQVLKSLVWQVTGSRFAGVKWAAIMGKFCGFLGIIIGIFLFLQTRNSGGIWIGLIGWFIFKNAHSYAQINQLQESLTVLVAADAMTRDFRIIDAKLSLQEFANQYVLLDVNNLIPYYATSEGRYRGLVNVSDLQLLERSQWKNESVESITHPLNTIPSVEEKTPLVKVITKLEEINQPRITVLSPAGTVAGIIDRGDIVRAIAIKHKLAIPEAEIKRIKLEGNYPPNLPFPEIAKTMNIE